MSRLHFAGWCILGTLAAGTVHAQTTFNDFFLNRPGIISHWGMEETSGTTVADSITTDGVDGNNPGTFVAGQGASLNAAGPRPSDGFAGLSATNRAIDFAGTIGQRLDMNPAGYTGSDGLVSVTMASWFRLTAPELANKHYHLGGLQAEGEGDNNETPGRYTLVMNSYPQSVAGTGTGSSRGGLRTFARVDGGAQGEGQYATAYGQQFWDSQWHFAATTLTPYGNASRMLRLYVDGRVVTRDASVEPPIENAPYTQSPTDPLALRDRLTFGQDAGDNSRLWVGQLDGITTFDRDLSSAEIGIAYMAAKGITVNHAVMPTRGLSAHRGASTMYPENTVLALKEAVRSGAHQVEFDVQMTSDGHLVLMHDNDLDRTTDGAPTDTRVKDLTLAQIKNLDAGTWKSPTFAGEKVPTLEEALDALPLNMWLNVEVKGDGTNDAAIAEATAAMLKEKGRLHQSFVSGSKTTANTVKAYAAANNLTIPVNNLDREGGNTENYITYTINNNYEYIQLQHSMDYPTPEQFTRLQNAGITVNYFYNEDPSVYEGMFDDGVHFILTNDPELDMGGALDYGIVPLLALYRGDFTMNGTTDTDDFDLFFQALTDPAGFATANPEFNADIYGDFNVDGILDVEDYQGFYNAVVDVPTIAGDYNLDGKVDTLDYAVWKAAFGLASAHSLVPADGNGDGVVNLADYTVWRDNLGATAAGSLSALSTNVPEPSAVVMLGGVLGAALLWTRNPAR